MCYSSSHFVSCSQQALQSWKIQNSKAPPILHLKRVVLKMLLQAYTTKFMVDQVKYTSLADARRSNVAGIFPSAPAPVPKKFGSFDDSTKYCGAVPTEHYLRDVWRAYFSELPVLEVDGVVWTREDYLHRAFQRNDGRICGGDASFKFAKIIRCGARAGDERTRPVYGIFTVFNEYEQV